MEREMEELKEEGEFWRPKELHDKISGTILEILDYGKGPQLLIKLDDGHTITTPAHKNLMSRIEKLGNDDIGRYIIIEFHEIVKTKNGDMNIYKVFIEKGVSISNEEEIIDDNVNK